MLGGPDSFSTASMTRPRSANCLPVYLNRPSVPQDGEELSTGAHTRRLAAALGAGAEDGGRREQTTGGYVYFSNAQQIRRDQAGGRGALGGSRFRRGPRHRLLWRSRSARGTSRRLLIGDLWRWGMRRENQAEDDFDRSWRQTVRWLVGDVPGRVEVTVRPKTDSQTSALYLAVRVRDAEYRPMDNAKVTFRVGLPGGDTLTLDAEPDPREAGAYATTYVPREPGAYNIVASATAPDGSVVGERAAGWAAQPAADEFARLEPDRDYLSIDRGENRGRSRRWRSAFLVCRQSLLAVHRSPSRGRLRSGINRSIFWSPSRACRRMGPEAR